MDEDLKMDLPDEDIKSSLKKKARPCPICGAPLRAKVVHGFMFCLNCHRRMPWRPTVPFDKSVKEEE